MNSIHTLTTLLGTWLLTYLVHSTVLLGTAWLATRLLGARRLALQELIWRAALLGGLITAALQVGIGPGPAGLVLGSSQVDTATALTTAMTAGRSDLATQPAPAAPAITSRQPAGGAAASPEGAAGPIATRAVAHGPVWPLLLLGLWLIGCSIGAVRLAVAGLRLRRMVRACAPIEAGPLSGLLQRLSSAMGLGRGVGLRTGRKVSVPFAAGVLKPRVYLPPGTDSRLAESQQEGLLAHELAHVARHDPAWVLGSRVVTHLLFIQPLNRLAAIKLRELSELLADDRAVGCTGRRLDLARCLVEVASWASVTTRPALATTALASGTGLGRRVERLLAGRRCEPHHSGWALPMVLPVLLATALLAPGISCTHAANADAALSTGTLSTGTLSAGTLSGTDPVSGAVAPRSPESTQDRPAPEAPRAPQEPEALPASEAPPAPEAVPALEAPPAPEASPAPEAPPAPASKVGARVADPEKVAKIERLAESLALSVTSRIDTAELERLADELAASAEPSEEQLDEIEALAERLGEQLGARIEAAIAGHDLESLEDLDELDDLDLDLDLDTAELEAKIEALVASVQPSPEQMATLEQRVAELVAKAVPTDEEMTELVETARQLERELDVEIDPEELQRMVDEAVDQARSEAENTPEH